MYLSMNLLLLSNWQSSSTLLINALINQSFTSLGQNIFLDDLLGEFETGPCEFKIQTQVTWEGKLRSLTKKSEWQIMYDCWVFSKDSNTQVSNKQPSWPSCFLLCFLCVPIGFKLAISAGFLELLGLIR